MTSRTLPIILLVTVLSGCAGIAVGTYGKKEWVRTEFSLAKARNQFSFEARSSSYSRADIAEHWGEPDATESVEACEVLIYKDGTSWAGVGAFVVVVPVPLMVPTGSYKNRFYLRDGVAVGLIQEYGEVKRMVGYTCGSNECGASFGENTDTSKEDSSRALEQWCAHGQ